MMIDEGSCGLKCFEGLVGRMEEVAMWWEGR